MYSCHLFLIFSASVRSLPFLSFIVLILGWNVPLIPSIFLKRSLVFPILLFSYTSLHCSFKKAFLSLHDIFQNSSVGFSSVQFSSFAQLCLTLCNPMAIARQASLSFTISWSLLKLICPLTGWCHLTISSSVVPFSSYLLSFPASGSFPTSQLFASGGQSIGASASASVLPMNINIDFL